MKRFVVALIVALVLLLAGAVVFALLAAPRPDPAPPPRYTALPATQRTLAAGKVVGFEHPSGAHAWLGIPYAAAPVGPLRWKPPVAVASWPGVREAVELGPMCVQRASAMSGASPDATDYPPVGQEDCLYLNVWAPRFAAEQVPRGAQARPVMVWLHGGGNSIGHSGNSDGARLAASQGVVVVTLNYRLGPFGWFRHPALAPVIAAAAAEDPADAGAEPAGDGGVPVAPDPAALAEASGNFANLDMLFALRWVQANIRAFGGDPAKVTLFGESAGGANTLSLMVSPLAAGLFQRAIVQSGGLRLSPVDGAGVDDAPAEGNGPPGGPEAVDRMLVADGRAPDLAAARAVQRRMSQPALASYLRDKDAYGVLAAYGEGFGGMIRFPAQFADGHVLPSERNTTALFSDRARFNAVPVILGTNRDEEKLFMVRDPTHVERQLGLFPRIKDKADYMRHSAYISEARKVGGADDLARAMTSAGHNQVYVYRFDWDEEASVLGFDLSEALGAAHGMEIAFVFGQFSGGALNAAYLYDEARIPARDALSARMMSYWAQFAYTGAPAAGRDGKHPSWTPWGAAEQHMLILDTEADGGARMSAEQSTYADLKARLLADQGFPDGRAQCEMYARIFHGVAGHWDDAEYEGLGGGACKGLDPEQVGR